MIRAKYVAQVTLDICLSESEVSFSDVDHALGNLEDAIKERLTERGITVTVDPRYAETWKEPDNGQVD